MTSSDPAIVEVLTPTVMVPAGSYQATARIRAATQTTGTVTITAGNPGFAPDTSQVSVTSALNILETFSPFGAAETGSIHLQLVSGGKPFPARRVVSPSL